ncbi:MAG TPA: TonB-dependent receptor [Vicinamibacterales bacterium]|nr:TonB-dependent receptor [Vicinamibacterales bacterium]
MSNRYVVSRDLRRGRVTAVLIAVMLLTGFAAPSFAQGVQTGTIRGTVRDQQGLGVPGVTINATSPALQGPRATVSDAEGNFTLAALPAGQYEVTFELSGFRTVKQSSAVGVGLQVTQNVTLPTGGLTEAVQVVAETPSMIATPTVGANIRKEEIDALATPRTIQGIATLAPNLTERSPNAGQVVINGAFAWDNVFMINGVDVNDNLFAQPQNLFIEDAIEETTVLTSGISAEYGRFSGGVVNAVTKSGGNTFSGSYRANLLNPSWTQETPFEASSTNPATGAAKSVTVYPDKLQGTHEATFGGPIKRDRLWFFTAGRYQKTDTPFTLQETGISLSSNDLNRRAEVKLTGTVAPNHTLQGGYLNNYRERTNNSGLQSFIIDPASEVDRTNPNMYYFTNYRGVRGNMMFEAQYSQRKFKFADDGGTSSNIIDSPFIALSCACLYNAPYFDATDPENRNNRQIGGNLTSFWKAAGRHETKLGYEFFRSQRTGGNSQSSTSYVFNADFALVGGTPTPHFVPGETYLENYVATRGATMNINNNSAYLQDNWTLSDRLTAQVGLRFEQVKVESTGDIVSVNTSPRLVPRLGMSYDLSGTGATVLHATYAQYSGRYSEAQVGGNSPVGSPATLSRYYTGPECIGDERTCVAGFALASYPITTANLERVEVPLANIFVDQKLKTPLTHEFTTSLGRSINGGRGFAEASYIFRRTGNMVEDFTTRADGTTHVVFNGIDAGTVSNVAYRNTDLAWREYQAVVLQGRYRFMDHLTMNGNYTAQLKNNGNYEGEGTNTPGSTSIIGDYPEAISEARHFPDGRLQNFQRHKVRAWAIYDMDMGRLGDMSVSGLLRVDSGLAYSLAARNVAANATQRAILAAAGYPDQLGTASVFFAERGSETFPGYGLLDTSIHYNVPVFKDLRPWVKFDVYNILNNQKVIAWSTTVSQDASSPADNLGLRTGYTKAASFGKVSGNTVTNLNSTAIPTYPTTGFGGTNGNGGRTFRVAMGLRF